MKIELEVQEITGRLVLRTPLARGTYGPFDFVTSNGVDSSLILEVAGRMFTVPTSQLVFAMLEELDHRGGLALEPGKPCSHSGCLSHVSHPCESCNRVAGQPVIWMTCGKCKKEYWVLESEFNPDGHCTCPDCSG